MKKIVIICFIIIIYSTSMFADSAKDIFLNDVFQTFTDIVDTFAQDYSVITGLYTTAGEVKGSASIGEFPSFRAGASIGTIFFRNPMRFIKKIDFYGTNWTGIQDKLESEGLLSAIDWFDQNFLPIPVTNFHFHVGLPYGLTVGSRFHIAPIGGFANAIAPASVKQYAPEILLWGLGVNFTYTILKEHKNLPTIAVGFGVQYSDTKIGIYGIPIGTVNLDESNDAIKSTVGFGAHNNNVSIYFDFSVSKRFLFFQPFFSMKFVQTINHNVTKVHIGLDLDDATDEARETYEKEIEVSNVKKIDDYNNEIGIVIPVTDFIISLGFEFVIKIFRLGLEGSFSVASQTGMITLGMRFQLENWQLKNIKNKGLQND